MSAPVAHLELGIVVALPVEAASLGAFHLRADHCRIARGRWVALAGVGQARAAQAAGMLVAHGVRRLLSWGLAGGLSPLLEAGDLIVPERIVAADGHWDADAGWHAQLRRALAVHEAGAHRLWSDARPVVSVAAKHELAARGLAAADMESAAVARIAEGARLPFAAVKVVCDPASRAVPQAALDLLGANGRLRWRGVPGAVRGGPRTWHELNVLRADFVTAQRTLERAAHALPVPSPV
jgi:nucleoside phosphorylase